MMDPSMMRDEYCYSDSNTNTKEKDACICGYELRKESEYISNQNQLVSIMICDSCRSVEHWIENLDTGLE